MLDQELVAAIKRRAKAIPISETLGFELIRLDEGECELKAERDPRYDGVFESLHGGLLMTIADSAACFAIFTLTGADVRLATTDMNIRFLSPCFSDVTARARVVKHGRTLCPVAIDLYDADGRHVAVSQVTYILLSE